MTWACAASQPMDQDGLATGMPAAFITSLALGLFIASAEASTPECV